MMGGVARLGLLLAILQLVVSLRPCEHMLGLQERALAEIVEYGSILRNELVNISNMRARNSFLSRDELESLGDVFFNTFTFTANFTWEIFDADCTTFVTTGDIPQMWLRDSSVQMSTYVQHLPFLPSFTKVIESIMTRQIRFFLGDPYGSAFYQSYGPSDGPNKNECSNSTPLCPDCVCSECTPVCSLYTYQHDFELDSPLFMFLLQYKYWRSIPNRAYEFLSSNHEVIDAIFVMIDLLITEQNHNRDSEYYYKPLPREFKDGTGLVWSFARPSDDQVVYGYNIPQNMMAVSVLSKLEEMNDVLWKNQSMSSSLNSLKQSIIDGINQYGIISTSELKQQKKKKMMMMMMSNKNGDSIVRLEDQHDTEEETEEEFVLAFEVDGYGNYSVDILDDANMPNLLWLPYIGYPESSFPSGIYNNTRKLILSDANLNYFQNTSNPSYYGLGSQHETIGLRNQWPGTQCESNCVWHLGLVMQAITASSSSSSSKEMKNLVDNKIKEKDKIELFEHGEGENMLHNQHEPIKSPSLTSDSVLDGAEEEEVKSCYYQVMNTSWHGLMHEGFSVVNQTNYNRDYFGWANAVFSEWIISYFMQ